jgi:phosphopantetheinyl transferase
MLYQKETFADGTTLGIWKIEEEVGELLDFFNKKRTEYLSEISRFIHDGRKKEFLAARCLLKALTECENNILYDKNGKPSFVDNSLNISISHTNGYVSVITHPSDTVGIDIEQRRGKILRLKNKFLSENELKNLDTGKETEHLLLHWSAKETMFKMMGETDVDFIGHLHILPFEISTEGCIHSFENKSSRKTEFNLKYKIHNDYVLVWGTNSSF